MTLFDPPAARPRHPATFTDALLPVLARVARDYDLALDPFAGTGKIHQLPNRTIGVELEPEWATIHPDTIVADALELPFPDGAFDAVVTSPTYGNRFADHHVARDGAVRHSYTHDLGRTLHPTTRERCSGDPTTGHSTYARGRRCSGCCVPAAGSCSTSRTTCATARSRTSPAGTSSPSSSSGSGCAASPTLPCPGLRYGQNHAARVDHEWVIVFDKQTNR